MVKTVEERQMHESEALKGFSTVQKCGFPQVTTNRDQLHNLQARYFKEQTKFHFRN